MSKTVEFFWDAASSYSYLASTQIEAVVQRAGASLVWRPFLLGKVFEASGNKMPAAVPAKGRFLFKDCAMWARLYGVPFTTPAVFPLHSVLALRLALAAEASGQQALISKALMRAYWGEGQDLSKPEVALAVVSAAGADANALLAATQQAEVKDRLRVNTDEAIARGAFGAPCFFVGEQMFWGNDRLGLLEAYLKGELG